MRLKINCDTCDARKITEENYTQYDEIIVNTDEMIVDDRSRAILNRLPFNICADNYKSEESGVASTKTRVVNGVYEITPSSVVDDNMAITSNGILKITPGTEEILKKYEKITVNGIILCPKSIAAILPLPNLSINGMTKVYPDEYVLLDNKYKLDKYFPMRAASGAGYYAARCVYDMDIATDFNMLAEKNVKFSTDKVYIRKGHLSSGLGLFNIEAEVVEIPDNCTLVFDESCVLDNSFVSSYGTNPYILGNLDISKENIEALRKLESLTVDGTIRINKDCMDVFESLHATYNKLEVKKGVLLCDRAMLHISKDILEENAEGVTVEDCAIVKLDSNIEPALIKERMVIRDCAKVECTPEQRSAVDQIAKDVALVSSGGLVSGIFNTLFGNSGDASSSGNDSETKYINADYYEL